jgi:hypothetical protein
LIFDLLFSNTDRDDKNFLVKDVGMGLNYLIYGIDHDSCMGATGQPLKIDYLDFTHAFNTIFVDSIKELVSEKNVQKYKMLMEKGEISGEAIAWMEFASRVIRNAIEKKKMILDIVRGLIEKFENHEYSSEYSN